MNFRTDLAIETREYSKKKTLAGVLFKERKEKNIKITEISITNKEGEKALGKPQGRYITLETGKISTDTNTLNNITGLLSHQIKKLLPEKGSVMVVGLGNKNVTADALGPDCISLVFSTRHLSDELKKAIGMSHLRSVCSISPGVLGNTGIESSEIVSGVCKKAKPDAVIVIDALCARNTSRLGTTIQLCNTGIHPGSGVGNHRNEISEKTLGVPVISIGVPTVITGSTMALDILEKNGITPSEEQLHEIKSRDFIVTPKEIDELIKRSANVVAMAINLALQEELSLEELWEIVG